MPTLQGLPQCWPGSWALTAKRGPESMPLLQPQAAPPAMSHTCSPVPRGAGSLLGATWYNDPRASGYSTSPPAHLFGGSA